MIEITKEMKNERKQRLTEMEAKIDKHILNAVKNGNHSAYFACDRDIDKEIYDEIRKKYEAAGYIIKPTGYIGGVWQLSEDICW